MQKIHISGEAHLTPITAIRDNPRNARKHSPEQIGKLAGLIKEFGFIGAVVIDESGELVAGHGRLAAARLLKMTQVPAITVKHLTESQRRALVIADNKIGLESSWDMDKLTQELAELSRDTDIELGLTAFGNEEIANILAAADMGLDQDDGGDAGQEQQAPPPQAPASFKVTILCASLFEQENILEECKSRGWNAKS